MARHCIPFPAPLDPPREAWLSLGQEPDLEEVLADPMVHLVMRRDGVAPAALAAIIAAARARLRGDRCWCCAA